MLVRKLSFRFGLYVACLSLTLPAVAQTTFDPFAKNAVAPTEPMAGPTAPLPVAPKLPAPPAPSPAVVIKAPSVPRVTTPVTTQRLSEPSLPQQVPVIRNVPTPVTSPVKVAAPSSVKKIIPYATQAPAAYNVPANPKTTDPFAASNVAPSLPTDTPQAATPQAMKTPKPVKVPSIPEPITAKVVTSPQMATPDLPTDTPQAATTQAIKTFKPNVEPLLEKNVVKEISLPAETPVTAEVVKPVKAPSIPKPITAKVVTPPAPVQTPTAYVTQAPAPYNVPANPNTTDPFAASNVAPSLPTDAPQAPTPLAMKVLKPVVEPLAEKSVVKEVSLPTEPVVTSEVVPPVDEEPLHIDVLERIGNFFSDAFNFEDKPVEPIAEKKPEVIEKIVEQVEPEIIKEAIVKPQDPRLAKATFGLGQLIKLGQGDDDLSKNAKCFIKNRGTVTFCLTPTKWPSKIRKHFAVSSPIYRDMQGIVQFDGNLATRLFGVFNKDGFQDIVNHYENKFGPASLKFTRRTRTLSNGTVDNPVYVWKKENTDDGLVEIFEIRQTADLPGSLPDVKRGSIQAYFEGAAEIFARSSHLDFMDLR